MDALFSNKNDGPNYVFGDVYYNAGTSPTDSDPPVMIGALAISALTATSLSNGQKLPTIWLWWGTK